MTTMAQIIAATSAATGFRRDELTGPCREAPLCRARFAMMAAARRLGKSLHRIAAATGGRNHTSVLHAVRVAEDRARFDGKYATLIADIVNEAAKAATTPAPTIVLVRPAEEVMGKVFRQDANRRFAQV